MKRFWVLMLALSVLFCLCGCSGSDEAAVYVQSVEYLSNAGGIAPGDRFAGVVVSENVAQVKKDEDKTVAELLVKEGDDVEAGQELFRYDTDQLQLELDRKTLELDQLKLSIENYKSQITELENQRSWAGSDGAAGSERGRAEPEGEGNGTEPGQGDSGKFRRGGACQRPYPIHQRKRLR